MSLPVCLPGGGGGVEAVVVVGVCLRGGGVCLLGGLPTRRGLPVCLLGGWSEVSMADLRGVQGMHAPLEPNSFNFMKFLGKFGKNRMLAPPG